MARLVEAIVNASETQTAQSAQLLQQILASAANESGEWHWPLPEAQAASFEQVWRLCPITAHYQINCKAGASLVIMSYGFRCLALDSRSSLQAILDNLASLDEALLSNAFAWMRRCKDDGLTGDCRTKPASAHSFRAGEVGYGRQLVA